MKPDCVNPYESKRARNYALVLLTVVYAFNFIDRQLLAILQEHGIMNPTPPDRAAEVQLLLSRLY
mgnify:CR=1 FL=1